MSSPWSRSVRCVGELDLTVQVCLKHPALAADPEVLLQDCMFFFMLLVVLWQALSDCLVMAPTEIQEQF